MNLNTSIVTGIPILLWLLLFYQKDKRSPEPIKMLLAGMLFGILSGAMMIVLHREGLGALITNQFSQGISQVLFAMLEEVIKITGFIALWKCFKPPINQIIDAVIYAITIALGFAFVENIYYVMNIGAHVSDQLFWQTLTLRSVITTAAHVLLASIIGLAFGHALLSKNIFHKSEALTLPRIFQIDNWFAYKFHIIWCHVCQCHVSNKGHDPRDLMREVLLISIIVHAAYNLAFLWDLQVLLVPVVVICFLMLFRYLKKKHNLAIWQPI